jgi:hypothetical protein
VSGPMKRHRSIIDELQHFTSGRGIHLC